MTNSWEKYRSARVRVVVMADFNLLKDSSIEFDQVKASLLSKAMIGALILC
jgi:hypothetical protein